MFALVDANYNFMFVDVGNPGSMNDAAIWQQSSLKKALDRGALHLPDKGGKVEYHFLGDDIFPLTCNLMKPYTRSGHLGLKEKVYNYR